MTTQPTPTTVDEQYTEKYTVTKNSDGTELPPGSFFVVRSKDVFATSALYAYAQSIQTLLDAQDIFGIELDPTIAHNLSLLADQLVDKARDWETPDRKVPD